MGALYHELRLEKSNVNTLTIHPGFTGTNMLPEKYRKPQIIEGYVTFKNSKIISANAFIFMVSAGNTVLY